MTPIIPKSSTSKVFESKGVFQQFSIKYSKGLPQIWRTSETQILKRIAKVDAADAEIS